MQDFVPGGPSIAAHTNDPPFPGEPPPLTTRLLNARRSPAFSGFSQHFHFQAFPSIFRLPPAFPVYTHSSHSAPHSLIP